MTFKNFATPHCHVQSLDSASTPQAFAERELELGTGVITVTDHGSLAACQSVYELAKKKGLTPVLGLEGYFRDDDCPIFKANGVSKNEAGTYADYLKYCHFTVHFLNQHAYNTGVKLLSRAPVERHGSEAKPLFNWDDMEELAAADTTLTTGCLIGMVQRHLLQNNDPRMAIRYLERMIAITRPGQLYVEAFPHVCSHNWVQGVFLTVLEEGSEVPIKLRFYTGKNLKTNHGEIKAGELAKEWKKRDHGKHEVLLAVKDYHTWNERVPARLIEVEHVEDFIQNECRPWCTDGDVQRGANEYMIGLAQRYKLPVLISDDSHYAHPDEKVVQDVRLAQSGSWRFYGSYHRQSSQEAWEYFSGKFHLPQATFEGWIENSHEWASRFKDFKFKTQPSLPTKFYEAKYAAVGASNSLEYTLHLIKKHGRLKRDPVYDARLKQEIDLLYRNGTIDLLPYFFIDEEVCSLYTSKKLLTGPGRGSAAGLLLTYYLGITHVDPIKYGLSVDRFLTVDRIKSGKLPDIDQDLPHRDLLVGEDGKGGWLQERFGDHVAQISTVMTLKLRSAVLDVARFTMQGRVPPDIAELTRKFEMPPQGLEDIKHVLGYEDSGNWIEGSINRDPALQTYIANYPDQWEVVKKCLGLGRGVSRHACAYVIANEPITELGIPLTEIGGVKCTAFTSGAVEAMGGLKMDFLVINSLNDIASAIGMVQQRSGMFIPEDGQVVDGKWVPSVRLVPYKDALVDIWDLPSAQSVFADVSCGRTETVFQFNTPGAVQWLRHFSYKKPNGHYAIDSVESMAAFTALDRPGPLDARVKTPGTDGDEHNMLVEFARRARGADASPSIFVMFDQLFPETHGVMVYQEQLQRLYQEVTGCTGAEAEAFRGNIAKKLKEKVIAAYPGFIEGGAKKLGSRMAAENVWQFVNSWAAYGFNKSHAVCYSVIGYACAFLKHFYPLEWWTAVLQNAKKEEINEKFWRHCGHLIDLPDVTNPVATFTITNDRIQAPLSLLHGVGETAHAELLANAPYTSINDLVLKREAKKLAGSKKSLVKDDDGVEKEKTTKGRSSLHDGIVNKLIVSGAMDKLFPPGWSTLEMLAAYQKAVFDYAQAQKKKPSKKAAPKKVPKELVNLNMFTRYQLRKEILPAYSEPVLPMLVASQHPGVVEVGGRIAYRWARTVVFAGPEDIARYMEDDQDHEGGMYCAVACYIDDVRIFEYGKPRKDKRACELVLDVNGERIKIVRWPDRDTGELDGEFNADLKGAIAIVVLSKFKARKPFSISHIEIVQPAPDVTVEETPANEESKE